MYEGFFNPVFARVIKYPFDIRGILISLYERRLVFYDGGLNRDPGSDSRAEGYSKLGCILRLIQVAALG